MREDLIQNVIDGNLAKVQELVQRALDAGTRPAEILNEAMIVAMAEVGQRFERRDFFVPEMLLAARAMKGGLQILQPHLTRDKVEPVGKVVIGTVKGDLHDIGKNLVAMMLEGAGFQVIDLGVDVSPQKFAAAVRENGAKLLGLSALLTTTMPHMKDVIAELERVGLRDKVTVMVGGAPATQRYADEVGADLYARDASSAAERAKHAIAARRK